MLRVAPYCRVSTDSDDQINSLENQKKYFNDFIKNKENWAIVDMYVDEGITGTSTKKRKAFNRLMEDSYNGKVDLIITKEVSRFARNTVDTLSHTRKLKDYGVGVFFISDNIDTRDRDGEFRLTIMASVAQEESRKTSERVKWGMKRQMENGYVFVNTVLGYDVIKGEMTINEDEAKIVRTIFDKFVYEGKGSLTIAKELIDEKIPVPTNKRMKKWSAINISRILKNEKYVGDLLQKKTYTPNYLEQKSVRNNGQEEKVFIANNHEGIIDRKTWNLAVREIDKRSIVIDDKSRYSNTYWCSGKIFCSECKSILVPRTKYLKSGKYKAWRCKEATFYGSPRLDGNGNEIGCINGQINEKALNECVRYAMKKININSAEIKNELKSHIMSVQNINEKQDTKKHEKKIQSLYSKKERIIDLLLEGTISKEEMSKMKVKYDSEIAELESKINTINDQNNLLSQSKDNTFEILNKIDQILNGEEISEEIYRDIIDKIIMYPTSELSIYFKYLPNPICMHYESSGRGEKYKTLCSMKNSRFEPII